MSYIINVYKLNPKTLTKFDLESNKPNNTYS